MSKEHTLSNSPVLGTHREPSSVQQHLPRRIHRKSAARLGFWMSSTSSSLDIALLGRHLGVKAQECAIQTLIDPRHVVFLVITYIYIHTRKHLPASPKGPTWNDANAGEGKAEQSTDRDNTLRGRSPHRRPRGQSDPAKASDSGSLPSGSSHLGPQRFASSDRVDSMWTGQEVGTAQPTGSLTASPDRGPVRRPFKE